MVHGEQGKGQDRSSDVSLTPVFGVLGLTHKRCVSMVIKVRERTTTKTREGKEMAKIIDLFTRLSSSNFLMSLTLSVPFHFFKPRKTNLLLHSQ